MENLFYDFINEFGEDEGKTKYLEKKNFLKRIILNCLNCNNYFITSKKSPGKYCCKKCAHVHQKETGIRKTDNSSLKFYIEKYGEEVGRKKYEIRYKKISNSNKGKSKSTKNKTYEEIYGEEKAKELKERIRKTTKETKRKNREEKAKINKEKYYKEPKDKEKSQRQQGMWTLNWFKKKYGDAIGEQKYKERSAHLSKVTYWREYNKTNKKNYSKISQKLFWEIFNKMNNKEEIYFGELNHEFSCGTNTNYDFVDNKNKKIIEFHGDSVHGNPKFFKKSDILFHGYTVEDKHKLDEIKIKNVLDKNYLVYIVWEDDYKNNKDECLQKCMEFLNG